MSACHREQSGPSVAVRSKAWDRFHPLLRDVPLATCLATVKSGLLYPESLTPHPQHLARAPAPPGVDLQPALACFHTRHTRAAASPSVVTADSSSDRFSQLIHHGSQPTRMSLLQWRPRPRHLTRSLQANHIESKNLDGAANQGEHLCKHEERVPAERVLEKLREVATERAQRKTASWRSSQEECLSRAIGPPPEENVGRPPDQLGEATGTGGKGFPGSMGHPRR